MNEDIYKGYRGESREALERLGVRVWNEVEVTTSKGTFHGVILPRSEIADDRHIVLKMNNGYNVGILARSIVKVRELGYREAHYGIAEPHIPRDPHKPSVTLLGTGGTIASRLDYRTGAVIPAFTPGDLYGAVPELAELCNLKTEKLYGIFSEN
ncbi:MAG: asparaginase, partial [Spirochaetales bacterium]|nr:asparaginase [Spirochaetales bacterium]